MLKELNVIKTIPVFINPVLVGGACKGWSLSRSVVTCIYHGPVCAGDLRLCLGEPSQLAHTASVSHTEAQKPRLDPDFRANKALNLLGSLEGVAQLKTVANNT